MCLLSDAEFVPPVFPVNRYRKPLEDTQYSLLVKRGLRNWKINLLIQNPLDLRAASNLCRRTNLEILNLGVVGIDHRAAERISRGKYVTGPRLVAFPRK